MARSHTVLILLVAVISVYGEERQEREPVHALEKRHFECKALFDSCRGLPRCCEDLQCYWENGYSAFTDGYCVECIDRGQKCQRDAQCCEPLVCQKGGKLHVDGTCDVRRENGSKCHENDNCASKHCHKKWYHIYGTCQAN